MAGLRLLVSDLDGTLVGHDPAADRFRAWHASGQGGLRIVYATGRSFESVRALVLEGEVPAPEFVISAVGTEIHEFVSGERAAFWGAHLAADWDAGLARQAARGFPELDLQPEEFQTAQKVSFFAGEISPGRLAQFERALAARDLRAELIYSCGRYLDVLPRGMNKGAAARRLAREIGVASSAIAAAGDSGNDLPLFAQGFCGIVVGNAQPELTALRGADVYHSPFTHADGVIDGLEHWLAVIRDDPARRAQYASRGTLE